METKLCLFHFISIYCLCFLQPRNYHFIRKAIKIKTCIFFSSRFKKVQKLRGVKPAQKSSSSEPFFEPSNLTTGDKVWTFEVFQGKYVLRPKEPLKNPSNISGF